MVEVVRLGREGPSLISGDEMKLKNVLNNLNKAVRLISKNYLDLQSKSFN